MPTVVSEPEIDELATIIQKACERGDNVSAIAERAGVPRTFVSGLKNGTYRFAPSLDNFKSVCLAVGAEIVVRMRKP